MAVANIWQPSLILRFYWSIISKNNIGTHKNSKIGVFINKLSQSNFNLLSPDCYLDRSYLIATVIGWKMHRMLKFCLESQKTGKNLNGLSFSRNESYIIAQLLISYQALLAFFYPVETHSIGHLLKWIEMYIMWQDVQHQGLLEWVALDKWWQNNLQTMLWQ